MRLSLYTSASCVHCRRAKAFLRRHEIPFREMDMDRNRRARSEFQRLGGRALPLFLVGDQRLNGFDPVSLGKLLRRSGFRV